MDRVYRVRKQNYLGNNDISGPNVHLCDTRCHTYTADCAIELRKLPPPIPSPGLHLNLQVHIFRDGTFVAPMFGPLAWILPKVLCNVLFEVGAYTIWSTMLSSP